jgi:GT2 family glycosyltransferase
MNEEKLVSVIITNYNGRKLLKKNLPLVAAAFEIKSNKIGEVIVVDDGSNDDSVSFIHNNYLWIRLIKHRKNRGFPAAANMGARSAKYKYLALLNNDVAPKSDFLLSVIPHFEEKDIFAVSFDEGEYSWTEGKFENGFIIYSSGKRTNETHETFWASGGSAVFRRKYWMELGGFDEKLLSPFYWEDVDIGYRAMKRGWRILWEPQAKVIHEHESTMSKISEKYRRRVQERNQLILIWKNLTSPNLFKRHLSGLVARLLRHPGYVRILLMAAVKLKDIRKARIKEKKESKVSDEAIFAKFK